MVDGYTTDKHATQVETFADTTQTLLFPLDEGVTIEEAQDEVIFTHSLILCLWYIWAVTLQKLQMHCQSS